MRERIETEIDTIVQVYFSALESKDVAVRLRAADALLDRVYGKSTTPIEHTGDAIDRLDELMAGLDDDGLAELQRLAARVR